MSRVVVLGSINLDVVVRADRHPRPGETVHGHALERLPGGKGANQAVAAARAGAPTTLVARIGRDEAGRAAREHLEEAGVDTTHVLAVDGAPTGTALVTVAEGENSIVVVAGANGHLDGAAVDSLALAAGDVVVAQFETPVEVTVLAFAAARAAGARTVLNPAPAGVVPPELLAITDYLVANEHEAQLALDHVDAAFEGVLMVTLGAQGVRVEGPAARLRVPGHPVDVVDSTGAGDCFVGYLAAELAARAPLEAAVRTANDAAALSVTRSGAARSIPHREELLDAGLHLQR